VIEEQNKESDSVSQGNPNLKLNKINSQEQKGSRKLGQPVVTGF
jgi:hypothetical protein